jgi:hypothetical protein
MSYWTDWLTWWTISLPRWKCWERRCCRETRRYWLQHPQLCTLRLHPWMQDLKEESQKGLAEWHDSEVGWMGTRDLGCWPRFRMLSAVTGKIKKNIQTTITYIFSGLWFFYVLKYIDIWRKTNSFDHKKFQTCGNQNFDFDDKIIVIDYKTCHLLKRSIFSTTHFGHAETKVFHDLPVLLSILLYYSHLVFKQFSSG